MVANFQGEKEENWERNYVPKNVGNIMFNNNRFNNNDKARLEIYSEAPVNFLL